MRSLPLSTAILTTALTFGLGCPAIWAQPAAQKQPPKPGPERPFAFPAHTTTKLENGLTVFVIEDHRQPLVTATLMLPGAGAISHPGEKAGLAGMTAALLRQGTATRSAQQIAEAIDRVGGSLTASAGDDSTEVSVTVLTSALATGFELLADVVQRPAFAQDEIERWRRQTLSGLQVAYNDPEYLRNVVGQRVAYGNHPYGYPTDGFPDTVRALTREDVQEFHKTMYSPAGAFLAVAGDITTQAAVALARKHLGDWKGRALPPPGAPDVRHQRRIVVVDKPDAVQTQFGMVGAGVPRSHADWLSLSVANQVLGAGFNSRLNMRLRAKEGLTYGARSSLESNRLAGVWGLTSFTRTDETVNAIRMTLEVVDEFRKNPTTPAELAEATSYMSGVFAIQTETAGAVAGRVLTSALHGLPADYWRTYRDRVRKISASDVSAAVERHLHPEQLSIVAVGNAGGFAKALESLGIVSIVPAAKLDLTRPDLMTKSETAAGPDATARAEAIVRAAVEAAGGTAALAAVKDSTGTGNISLVTPAGEMQGKATATVQQPDKVKLLISLDMGEFVQVFDGSQGWMRFGQQPPADLAAEMIPELRRAALLTGGIGVLREAVEGRAAVSALEPKVVEDTKLERVLWKKDGLEMTLGFDPESRRLVNVSYRGQTMQGPADIEVRYAAFNKT
ncbi:MAG TPA: pitrilysin family protein, partial [Vicinamibacterales bacterium]|nr:pitrilysin family protein [Vicinamibacterales bacterium]